MTARLARDLSEAAGLILTVIAVGLLWGPAWALLSLGTLTVAAANVWRATK